MGIFSSGHEYYAYAGTGELFPEEDRTDTVLNSLLEATAAGESLSRAITFGLATDMGARAKAMIKYAARFTDPSKPGGYVRGLPTSTQQNIQLPGEVLIAAIASDIGEPVNSVVWMSVGNIDEGVMVYKHIKEVYMDPAYFPWPAGDPVDPVWDENRAFIEIPVVDPTTGAYYSIPNTPQYRRVRDYTDPDETEYYAGLYEIQYVYTDSEGNTAIWKMEPILDLTQYLTGTWITAKYETTALPGNISYWTYQSGSGGHPGLDASIVKSTIQDHFMPVVIMMHDRVWYDGDYNYDIPIANRPEKTQLHYTTDKILKKFAIKGREVKEGFLEQQEEDKKTPGYKKAHADVWDFIIHFAVPIHTEIRGSKEYLFHFFLEMEKNQQYSFEEYQTYLASSIPDKNGYRLPQPISELSITEGNIDGYNVKYGWSYIYSETFEGVFQDEQGNDIKGNHYDSARYERKHPAPSYYPPWQELQDANYSPGLHYMHGEGILLGKYRDIENHPKSEKNGFHDYIILTKQHRNNTHTRVLCMGLSMQYKINTIDIAADKDGYRFRYAQPDMFDIDPETNLLTKEFRIPIHIKVLQNMVSRIHHEEVIGDAMGATVFLTQDVKIPFYQKTFFKWLIVVIAIILIVLSFIYGGGTGTESLLGVIGAALGATGATLVILFVVLIFAMGIIFALAAQTIGEEFGSTWGTVFLIISMIASGYQKGGWAGTGTTGWAYAANVLTTVFTYANYAAIIYQDYALAKMDEDLKEFMLEAKDRAIKLQEAWDQLGDPGNNINPLLLTAARDRGATGEHPDTFQMRKLNMNPGLLAYDMIFNYIPMALHLEHRPGIPSLTTQQFEIFAKQRGEIS